MGSKCVTVWKIPFIAIFIFLIFATGHCLAASFRADMVIVQKGNRTVSKFFHQDNHYRMDVEEDGKPLTILVDRTAKKTRVIDPSRKTYQEFSNAGMRSLMLNPFEAYQNLIKKSGLKSLGKEAVNGIDCEKQAFEIKGEATMTAWVSPKLNFPIKLIYPQNDYMTELQRIKEGPLNKDLFTIPPNFVKQEETTPKTVKPKKKAAVTGKETFEAPIGRRVGPGGVMTVKVNPWKHIALVLVNEDQGASSAIIHTLKNNTPFTVKSMGDKNIHFEKLWDKKRVNFEDKSNPDELRLEVTKGMIYVIVNQESPMWEKEQSKEIFLKEPIEYGFLIRPDMKITCRVVGDSQDEPEGKLKVTFFKDNYKTSVLTEEIVLKNGQSRQWDFNADQNIRSGEVYVKKGVVQLYVHQEPKQAASGQVTPKQKSTPKAKAVTQFTVTEPYGTNKPLTPGKNLAITVTGVSDGAKGDIELFSDQEKTQKIDQFGFTLKKNQAKSHFVSEKNKVVWARVWVHKGSFKVKLDQSPDAKAVPTPKKKKTADATVPKPKKEPAAVSDPGPAKVTASSGTILKGEVPLYKGAQVIKTKISGPYATAGLKVDATPQEIVDFYKQAMTAKGWEPSMAMVQGNKGILMFKKSSRQLVFKVKGQGNTSKVDVTIINQ